MYDEVAPVELRAVHADGSLRALGRGEGDVREATGLTRRGVGVHLNLDDLAALLERLRQRGLVDAVRQVAYEHAVRLARRPGRPLELGLGEVVVAEVGVVLRAEHDAC